MTQPEITFRNSSVADFILCPAMFYFGWYLNLQPVELNINLEFGSSMHYGAEYFFNGIMGGRENNEAFQNEVVEVFLADFNLKEFSHRPQKNVVVGEALLRDLFYRFRDLQPEDIVSVEKRYEKRIKGYTYTGKIDLLLRKRNKLIVYDHKTTGKLTSNMYSKWALSRQIIGYQWLTGADKMFVNVLYCVEDENKRACIQHPFNASKFKQERWEYQTLAILDDITNRVAGLETYMQNPRFKYVPDMLFPRYATKCNIYSCPFESLCSQDSTITDIIIPSYQFKEREEGI